jgi:hypothetical protein
MSMTDDLMKASPTSTELGEIGSTGLVQYGGEVREDFLRQLQGKRGLATYREMADNHPVIGAILYAVEMLVRGVDWTVSPSDPNDQRAVDEATFVSTCMTDMSHSWPDTLSSVLSMLTYGYCYTEVVYKRRLGPDMKDASERSKHVDGRYGWRKWPIRDQSTITRWKFDEHGGIDGAWQMDTVADTGEVFLPIERCLLFRTSTKRNNPQGRSILRNAFVPWYFQKRIQEIEAIGIERDLAGLPVALVPPHLLSDNATAQETAALTAIKQIVRNVRRDEQEGIVFPLAYDPDTKQLAYDLKLLSTGGRRQFDTSAIISRYDGRIAMTTLADFILLGHDKVGTQALSVSKIQLFADALETWVAGIADVINTHAIPRLMRLNGVDSSLFPSLDYSTPRQVDIGVIADYVSKLAGVGAILPDENLGAHLRDIAGLPQEEAEAL